MRSKHFGRKKETDETFRERSQITAFLAAAITCLSLLTLTTIDSEKYKEDSVAASLTYTNPVKAEETGFWDIFSQAVVSLFSSVS